MNSPEREAALEWARQTLETLAKYFTDDTDTGDEWKNRCGKDFQEKIPIARQLLAMHEENLRWERQVEELDEYTVEVEAKLAATEAQAALYRKALQRCEVFMRHLASIKGEIPAYDMVTLNEIRCKATLTIAFYILETHGIPIIERY